MTVNKKIIIITLILLSLFMMGAVSAASDTDIINSDVTHKEKITTTASDSSVKKTGTDISTSASLKKTESIKEEKTSINKTDTTPKIKKTPSSNEVLKSKDDETSKNLQNKNNNAEKSTILQSTEHRIYGKSRNNTFKDLFNDISTATKVFNMKKNYKFDKSSDVKQPIIIDVDNFIINGNNYTLDGSGQSSMFIFMGKNITVNNLKFVNGYSDSAGGAIIAKLGSLILNNVTFINNTAKLFGGAIIASNATVKCSKCNFLDSCSNCGSAFYLETGNLNVKYSNFTSKYFSHWGSIFSNHANKVCIDKCIFNNISSNYTPAVFAQGSYLTINNTKFNNLRAKVSAGAVGIRLPKKVIIENCKFVNISSTKNAGALFIDVKGPDAEPIIKPVLVRIQHSTFNNISSGFGGALVQLTGNLTLKDSSFNNCFAVYAGGAAYLSNVFAKISNCKFNSNKVSSQSNYQTSGGALYFDYGCLKITDSKFNKNNAPMGSGILIYDSEYHLDNITFNNNKNSPVYTYFDKKKSTIGRIYGNNKISRVDLNNTYYLSVVTGEGIKLNLITNNIDLTLLPARFYLKDIGWVTPVRNQGNLGACWSFGSVAAFESALLKNTGIVYNISENNLLDSMIIFSRYGSFDAEGSDATVAAGYLLSWLGPVPREYDRYDEVGKLSKIINTNKIHLQDFIIIGDRNILIPGDPALKKAILKYGALAICYDSDQDPKGYNDTSGAFYHRTGKPNHVVALVGWDDNYPKENFATKPKGDGAWIIKNSWGTQRGDEGYMYISYYDLTLSPDNNISNQAVGFIFKNTLSYNKNYQYDFAGINEFISNNKTSKLYGAPITNVNKFVSIEDDLIAAVGTYFNQSGMDYTIKVAVNGKVVYTQKGVSPYRGYQTIKLNKYIPIKKGDKFSIYVTSLALGVSYSRMKYEYGVSLTNITGSWEDLYKKYGYVACIKAYTLKDNTRIKTKNITVNYTGKSYFSVKVVTADGHIIVGASVKFKINNKTTTIKTNNKGIAKIKITNPPGKYTITTTYKGKTYKNTVTVKLNPKNCKIVNNKNIKINYASGSCFSVKVVSADGKVAAKGVSVKFIIKGKKTIVKTNKKGIAKIKINHPPGKYTIATIYNGKTYKNTVTVKHALKANKITVKKTNKKFTLKATLKIKNKSVKNKVIFKIKGKTYKVKPNAKGIAKKTLNKTTIGLKKGKTYTVKVTYLKDTIKTTVKVK